MFQNFLPSVHWFFVPLAVGLRMHLSNFVLIFIISVVVVVVIVGDNIISVSHITITFSCMQRE